MLNEVNVGGYQCSGEIRGEPGSVDIWHLLMDKFVDAAILSDCQALLSSAERTREERYRFYRDRCLYRMTRAAIRTVLSRYSARAPQDWEFEAGLFGKPQLIQSSDWTPPLEFSISHTTDMIVIAIGWGMQLGIDVEATGRQLEEHVARTCLTVGEQMARQALPPDHRSRRFIDLWTLKESYLKARGDGFNLAPQRLGFTLANDDIHFSAADVEQNALGWSFLQFELSSHHVVALCTDAARLRRINIRTAIPAGYDCATRWLVQRRSASLSSVEVEAC